MGKKIKNIYLILDLPLLFAIMVTLNGKVTYGYRFFKKEVTEKSYIQQRFKLKVTCYLFFT